MSDKFQGCTVQFTDDLRKEEAEVIIAAIRQLRGVAAVSLGKPVSLTDWAARAGVRQELTAKLWKVLSDE